MPIISFVIDIKGPVAFVPTFTSLCGQ